MKPSFRKKCDHGGVVFYGARIAMAMHNCSMDGWTSGNEKSVQGFSCDRRKLHAFEFDGTGSGGDKLFVQRKEFSGEVGLSPLQHVGIIFIRYRENPRENLLSCTPRRFRSNSSN